MLEPLRPLEDLLPLVHPHVYGASEPLMLQSIRLSVIDFCKRTRCWRHTVQVAMDEDGDDPIVAPANTSIFEIESAHFGMGLEPLTPIAFTDVDKNWLMAEAADTNPIYITMTSRNTVTVLPKKVGDLHLSLFLTPVSGPLDALGPEQIGDADPYDGVNTAPDFLFTDHAEVIAAGALTRLFLMPNVAWANPELAAYYNDRFDKGAVSMANSNIRGKLKAKSRPQIRWLG